MSQVVIVYWKKIEKKKALIFVGYSWVCAVSLIYCRSCVGEFAHPLKILL